MRPLWHIVEEVNRIFARRAGEANERIEQPILLCQGRLVIPRRYLLDQLRRAWYVKDDF